MGVLARMEQISLFHIHSPCQKSEHKMQKHIIKAGKTEKYFMALVSVWYLPESRMHEAIIQLVELGKERNRYGASEVRIKSTNKATLYQQISDLAKIYPPQKDIPLLDFGEMKE